MKKILIALALPVFLAGCSQEAPKEQAAQAPLVLIYQLVPAPIENLTFAGDVEPQIKLEKSFRAAGRVTSVAVAAGDKVHQGEVLATIDASTLQLQLKAAKAQLVAAEAQLANVTAANDRQVALFQKGVNSASAQEDAATNLAAAQSNYKSAKASFDKATSQMDYARIVADYDGVVLSSNLKVGQFTSSSSAAITIAKLDQRDAVIDVPEDLARRIKVGDAFSVRNIAISQPPVQGAVREMTPNANDTTGTYRIYVALDHATSDFRIGSLIEATYLEGDANVLSVPDRSLLTEDGASFVWRYDAADKSVHKVKVETGPHLNGRTVITSGIEADAKIVEAGVHSLHDGETVRPMTGDAQ